MLVIWEWLNCIFYEIFNEYQLALIHCYIDYSETIFRSKIISKSELYIFIKAKKFYSHYLLWILKIENRIIIYMFVFYPFISIHVTSIFLKSIYFLSMVFYILIICFLEKWKASSDLIFLIKMYYFRSFPLKVVIAEREQVTNNKIVTDLVHTKPL